MADTIMEMVIHQLENSVNKLVSDTSRIIHTITDEPHTSGILKLWVHLLVLRISLFQRIWFLQSCVCG